MSSILTLQEITRPISLVAFGPGGFDENDQEMLIAIAQADAVVALGGVNLGRLARLLPPQKLALCVLSGADLPGPPPDPFQGLHGRGVTVDGWRISGLSGAPLPAVQGGFVVAEQDQRRMLSYTPSCEILLSASPPAGYEEEIGDIPAYQALRDWTESTPPAYHIFGHPLGDVMGSSPNGTLMIGVNRWLSLPPFEPFRSETK